MTAPRIKANETAQAQGRQPEDVPEADPALKAIVDQAVDRKARQVMDVMKPGGGYVCSPSHDYLLPETPLENVLALYETIREYGSY